MTNKFKKDDDVRITRRIVEYPEGTNAKIKEYFKDYSDIIIGGRSFSISNNFLEKVDVKVVKVKEDISSLIKRGSKVVKARRYSEDEYNRYGYDEEVLPIGTICEVSDIYDDSENSIRVDDYNGTIDLIYVKFEGDNKPVDISELDLYVPMSKEKLDKIKKKIIKEINANKNFKECFDNVEEEVNTWDEQKLKTWDKEK